jgi:MoxR-like ATPase
MHGRTYVIPDDIKRFAQVVLGHRIILEPDLWTVRGATQNVIAEVLNSVAVPVAAAGR